MTWALAITAPRAEFKVAEALREREIDHHLFKIREIVARRGRLIERVAAAFPRYVFIATNGLHLLFDQVHDIIDYARDNANQIWRGDQHVLSEILARTDAEGFLPIQEIPCAFRLGEHVIVRGDNIITGYQAVFQRSIGNARAIVEQQWLGRYVPIVVQICDLEALTERRRKKKRRHHRSRRKNQGKAAP